jgi:galactokinase
MGLRAFAPGRVNLIGDHTDYMGGLVLPMAIGLGTEITGDRGGNWVMLGSDRFDGVAEVPLGGAAEPADVEPRWARYVAAVVDEVEPDDGLVGMVHSTLPADSGLASSAALLVAVACALGAERSDPVALAKACQRAEHRAVGVPVGIMDQLVSLAASEGTVLRIDCDSLDVDRVPFPEDAEIVVIHSGEHRELSGSAYAERRSQCEEAEALLGRPLREVTAVEVERLEDPVLARRARHVVTENRRVDAFAHALAADQLAYAGELLVASHASLRDDFEVSTPVLDEIVATVRGVRGVYGARVTGAGFGGCVVVLCRPKARIPGPVVWRGRPQGGASLVTTASNNGSTPG